MAALVKGCLMPAQDRRTQPKRANGRAGVGQASRGETAGYADAVKKALYGDLNDHADRNIGCMIDN